MMQPSENGFGGNAITRRQFVAVDTIRNLGLGRLRKSRSERWVRSSPIAMSRPFPQDSTDVLLTERDDPVETLSADRADQSFAERVRLRRTNRRPHNPNRHALQRCVESCGEYGIPVVDHESVGMIEGKELAELLNRPFSRWMLSDVAMENSSGAYLHGDGTYKIRKVAVTEMKKSQATIAFP